MAKVEQLEEDVHFEEINELIKKFSTKQRAKKLLFERQMKQFINDHINRLDQELHRRYQQELERILKSERAAMKVEMEEKLKEKMKSLEDRFNHDHQEPTTLSDQDSEVKTECTEVDGPTPSGEEEIGENEVVPRSEELKEGDGVLRKRDIVTENEGR